MALNLLFLGERGGGVGRYARELPRALLEADPRTDIRVLVSRAAPPDLRDEPWAREARWVTLPVNNAGAPLALAQYFAAPLAAALHRVDVLHSPANAGAVITPGLASVVSIMDVIWLVRPDDWDPDRAAQRAALRQVRHAVRHARQVLAISQAAADEISRSLGVDPDKLTVTPLGVRPPRAPQNSGPDIRQLLDLGDARVLLCVAQKRLYKNLHVLIEALPGLPADVTLVLPGAPTPYERGLRERASAVGVVDRVRFPDWLSDAELEALYATASAFVLPSLIEGFGLPVLEAMARGVPVACSNRSALPEVAGDAALLFDPDRQADVTRAVRSLLEDRALADRLVARGRARAAAFSWKRTGEATLAGYRAAVAARGASRRTGTSARR